MKRTTITRSRFITFIRSWRGNTAGLLLVFLVLLFFSCKDDAAIIGFPKDARLKSYFIDIPLNPSVLKFGAILTRNGPNDQLARIMVGKYNDPQLGNIEVKGFANIAAPSVTITPTATSVPDSLVLSLNMDFYYYGNPDSTQQHIEVFPVLDTIQPSSGYYSTTNIAYGPKPIGEAYFSVKPSDWADALVLNTDTDTANNVHQIVRVKLSSAFASNLLADMISNPTLFQDVPSFIGKYKGLAFVMKDGDKIVGINPVFTGTSPTSRHSRMRLYYSDAGVQSQADFPIYYANNYSIGVTFPGVSFSTITSNFNGTPLNGIADFTDFKPSDNHMYVQSGTGIVTKLDLTKFYEFVDTMDNVMFNSAEVVLNNVGTSVAPGTVQLRVLDSTNHFRSPFVDTLISGVITTTLDPYMGKIPRGLQPGPTSSNSVDVRADQGSVIAVGTDKVIGKVFVTEFCQQIFTYKRDKRRVKALAIMPAESEFQKSVSSFMLDPNIVLRIYYTRPIIKIR